MPSAADRLLCHPLQCTFPLILTGMHDLDLLLFILCLTPTLQPRCLFLSSSWIVGFSLSLCLRQPADLACRQCQWCPIRGNKIYPSHSIHILVISNLTLCTCHISRRKYNKMCKIIRHGADTTGCCWHGALFVL